MKSWKTALPKLKDWKYPILILALGVLLMLLPGKQDSAINAEGNHADALLCQVLSCSDGVGRAKVIVSERGVVVVCEGADNAQVRLDIIRAIGSYTGFGSDRITVLKMVKQ